MANQINWPEKITFKRKDFLDINHTMHRLCRVVHLSSRFFGMLSFSIDYDDQKIPKRAFISVFDILIASFFIFIRFGAVYSFVLLYQMNFPATVNLFLHGILLISIVLFTTLIIDSVVDLWNRHKLLKILKNIAAIDPDLNLIGIDFNHVKHTWFIVCFMMTAIVLETLLSISTAYTYNHFISSNGSDISYFDTICEIIVNFGVSAVLRNYVFCLLYVCCRLEKMKILIEDKLNIQNTEKCEYQIKILRRVYDRLTDVVKDSNTCFAFQVIFYTI